MSYVIKMYKPDGKFGYLNYVAAFNESCNTTNDPNGALKYVSKDQAQMIVNQVAVQVAKTGTYSSMMEIVELGRETLYGNI